MPDRFCKMCKLPEYGPHDPECPWVGGFVTREQSYTKNKGGRIMMDVIVTDANETEIEIGTKVCLYDAILGADDHSEGRVIGITFRNPDEPRVEVVWQISETTESEAWSYDIANWRPTAEGTFTGTVSDLLVLDERFRTRIKFLKDMHASIDAGFDNTDFEDKYLGILNAVVEGEADALVSADTLTDMENRMSEIDFEYPRQPGRIIDLDTGEMYESQVIVSVVIRPYSS